MKVRTNLTEALTEGPSMGSGSFPSRVLHDTDSLGGKYVLLVLWDKGDKGAYVFGGPDMMAHAGGNARAGNARSIAYTKKLPKQTVGEFKAKLAGSKYAGAEVHA